MDLSLSRQDLMQTSTMARKCMRLLPQGKKRQQKVVVGDDTGALTCFGMKKDQLETVFKTAPAPRSEIGRVELGGEATGGEATARIFWASGQTIKGITQKGKEFLRFNTNLTEPIRSMYIEGDEIHTGGEYIYNQFTNCKDTAFFMSSDRINDLTCEAVSGNPKPDVVLACQDRYIRVLSGSSLVYEAPADGAVSTVERYQNPMPGNGPAGINGSGFNTESSYQPPRTDGAKQLLYGTENGLVGELLMDATLMRRGWVVDPLMENRRGKAGGVHCICVEDITKDGIKDIMVGRDDGIVEVWSFDTGEQPKLVFERSLQESITSIDAGLITNSNFEEVVLSTYAGKLVSFSSEPSAGEGAEAAPADGPKQRGGERKIRSLMSELEKLRERVEKERLKYIKVSESLVAADAGLKLKDKWSLAADEACYKLHLELTVPLETVMLQCDVPVELLEADSNVAIVSHTTPEQGSSGLLATYRCQEVTNRLELRVRTSEGRYGSIQAFVWPRVQPKTCCAAAYAIKPLSLHSRLLEQSEYQNLPVMNVLKISGSFSLPEVHSWVVACLPEVPARVQTEEVSFGFRNTFLGTLLLCSYRKGDAAFRSDSLTSLAIVKEVLTKEATARKIQIQISVDVKDETVVNLLHKLDPMLTYQLSLNNKIKLIDSLKEVRMQENDVSFLAPEYLEILDNEEQIRTELKEQPGRLQFLHGIITDLYVDNYKFKGQNVAAQVPQLHRTLQDYSLESLLAFFNR